MPSSISRAAGQQSEPRKDALPVNPHPYNPETDPVILEARARLKNDFITKLCGEGSTKPSGPMGPIVALHSSRPW